MKLMGVILRAEPTKSLNVEQTTFEVLTLTVYRFYEKDQLKSTELVIFYGQSQNILFSAHL